MHTGQRFIYQAIVTRYHGPTNTRDSRISARAQGGKVMISWNPGKNSDDNHEQAALHLMKKLKWDHLEIAGGGALPDNKGNVYIVRERSK